MLRALSRVPRGGMYGTACRQLLYVAQNSRFITSFSSCGIHTLRPASTVTKNEHPESVRVMRPPRASNEGVDRTTSTEVWEMERGIFASWVPDALGYHTPRGLREREPPSPSQPRATREEEESLATTEAHPKGCDTEVAAEASESPTLQAEAPQRETNTESHHISSRSSSSRHSGRGRTGSFAFYGPVKAFEVSPVFEWLGGLWQWRPVEVRHARGMHICKTPPPSPLLRSSTTSQVMDTYFSDTPLKASELDSRDGVEWDVRRVCGDDASADAHLYLVPFLLLPTSEVACSRPRLHPQLRDAVLARHARHWASSRADAPVSAGGFPWRLDGHPTPPSSSFPSPRSTAVFQLFAPMPIGVFQLDTRLHNSAAPLSVLACMNNRLACRFDTFVPPLTPPGAETWGAATSLGNRSGGDDNGDDNHPLSQQHSSTPHEGVQVSSTPYVRVYSAADGNEVTPLSQSDVDRTNQGASATLSHFPAIRCNVIGGGLAELLLAVDRYAALLARQELTLSAACWATLCDTKSWWVVQKLRSSPQEVERELVAATAAQRRWQRSAVARNHTMIGKSSHGVRCDDYPLLAQWVGH
jgi:hypothetical protein